MNSENALANIRASDDGVLPLHARVGSVLQLPTWPLMNAYGSGSLIALPEQDSIPILAISRLTLNRRGVLHRYYLASRSLDDSPSFLQVYQSRRGARAEILYCTRLTRLAAETAEEQDAYTGTGGSGLGASCYTLWRTHLGRCGFDEEDLDFAFGAGAGLDYQRGAGDPDTGFIPPFTGTETLIGAAAGTGLPQLLYFMPYVRELDGGAGKEYLLITTECLLSRNGDAGKRDVHVDFVIGIPVGQARVAIA